MVLTPVMEKFVLHWGEMGTRWGVNRSVSQIHALLFLSGRPLHAEEIAETLSMARSNVSTSIKELQGWGIVHQASVLGDRRDHYATTSDVWEGFRLIMDERRKREIEPTIRMLRECRDACDAGNEPKPVVTGVKSMLEFMETADAWYRQMRALPTSTLKTVLKLGGKVTALLPGS